MTEAELLWPHIWVGLRFAYSDDTTTNARGGSETTAVGLQLGTIPSLAACHVRSRARRLSLSAIAFTRQRQPRTRTGVTFRKAGSSQGRARTCQVKKGMSPSCKHFLSGREHFLNPEATTSFAYFPANSRPWLSFSTHISITAVRAKS